MRTKIIVSLVVAGFLLFPPTLQARERSDEYTLYIIDDSQHLPGEFEGLLYDIQDFKPRHSKGRITDLIIHSYYTLRLQNVQVSIYEVAEGIKRFANDHLGIGLNDLVRAYVTSQVP